MNTLDTRAESTPANKADRFTARHFFAWLLFCTVFYICPVLDRLFNLWLLVILLMFVPGLIASGGFIVGLLANLWTRRWRRLACVIAAPVMTIGLLAALLHYQLGADWIYFQFKRHEYEEQLNNLPGPHPLYNEWDWGSTAVTASTNFFYTLVYDETDKPLEHAGRREPWKEGVAVKSYGHHFFLVIELLQ